MSTLYTKVNSIDVSGECGGLTIVNRVSIAGDSAIFEMYDPTNVPVAGQDVLIYVDDTSQVIFGGVILSVTQRKIAPGSWQYALNCGGYIHYFNRRLVTEHYINADFVFDITVSNIIDDIITNYTDPAMGFTTNNVTYNSQIIDIWFNYRYPSDCLTEMADMFDCVWYIDEDKDIHFHTKYGGGEDPAPYTLNDAFLLSQADDFNIVSDITQVRNRIFVQGGYILSDSQTVNYIGDGASRIWNLPYKPHNISLTVGGAGKTLGQENIDAAGSKEYFYNYYEKTLFADTGEGTPGDGVAIVVTMKFEYPLLVRVEDADSQTYIGSIEGGDGIYEYIIKDMSGLGLKETAENWGLKELRKHAFPLIEGSFSVTDLWGFFAGQSIDVDIADVVYSFNYIINQVTINSLGNNILRYDVEFKGRYRSTWTG